MSPPPLALEARMTVVAGAGASAFTVEAELSLTAGVLVLFGPSGAGKSLTVQALAGLIKPKRGLFRVQGETLFNVGDAEARVFVPPHRRRIGYVPQLNALFPFLSVVENVAFGLPRAERRADNPRIVALLAELGLTRLASARPASLSGGERQRVALARALAVEPRLLLLDEPFASIDEEARVALGATLKAATARRRVPAVLVTHDAAEAFALGDTLVRFERGRTTAAGPPAEMLGGREAVIVAGAVEGAARPSGGGRVQVSLREATVEAPAALLEGAAGEPLRLELWRRPGGRKEG